MVTSVLSILQLSKTHLMSDFLFRSDPSKEFYTTERCHILEMLNNHDNDKPFSIAKARVEPRVTTAWHRLSEITEFYYILNGKGFMEIGEEPGFEVGEDDIVRIPPDHPQRIENIGDDQLIFLAICNPPFSDKNYEELE